MVEHFLINLLVYDIDFKEGNDKDIITPTHFSMNSSSESPTYFCKTKTINFPCHMLRFHSRCKYSQVKSKFDIDSSRKWCPCVLHMFNKIGCISFHTFEYICIIWEFCKTIQSNIFFLDVWYPLHKETNFYFSFFISR